MTGQSPDAQAPLPEPEFVTKSSTTLSDTSDGWRRLHPLSPLLRGGLFVLVMAGIVLANLRDRLVAIVLVDVPWAKNSGDGDLIDVLVERDLVLLAFCALLVVLVLVVLFSWLGWRMHTYRISNEAVESRSGILFRQHRRAPLDRIQGVNLQRPMLARVLGLTMLEVATAGQDGKVKLNYLGHRDAKTVREQILAEVAAGRAGTRTARQALGAAADSNPAVTGASAAVPGTLPALESDPAVATLPSGLAHRVEDFADLDLDPAAGNSLVKVSAGRLLGATLLSWPTMIFSIVIVAIIVAGSLGETLLLIMLVPTVITYFGVTVGGFTRGMNFHLSLSQQGVRVSSGLISTVTETIPRGRIHAIGISQPLGWRPLGWWQVRITTAGLNPASNSSTRMVLSTMLPVGKFADVLRVLDVLMPGHGLTSDELREAMTGAGASFRGSPKRAAWILWFGRRRNGLQIAGDDVAHEPHLRLRHGWATRALALVPMVRIQSIELDRGLLHRGLGLASLTARTVLGPVQTRIAGIRLDDARESFEQVAAEMVSAGRHDSDARGTQ